MEEPGMRRTLVAEADRFDVRRVGRDDDLAAALHGANATIHLAGTLQPTRVLPTVLRTSRLSPGRSRQRSSNEFTGGLPERRRRRLWREERLSADEGEAEDLLRESGLEAVIVRSTLVFGPPDDPARASSRSSRGKGSQSRSSAPGASGTSPSTSTTPRERCFGPSRATHLRGARRLARQASPLRPVPAEERVRLDRPALELARRERGGQHVRWSAAAVFRGSSWR